jgi:two-component system chemotaxis sensor kinase CheA
VSEYSIDDPILDMYIFENSQLIEKLETYVLDSEKSGFYNSDAINDIFRVMHTIKGSSGMMLFNNISNMAHAMEDLFYFMREDKPKTYDCPALSDLILEGVDFIKVELEKLKSGDKPDGDVTVLLEKIKSFLEGLKQGTLYKACAEAQVQQTDEKQHYYIPHKKIIDQNDGTAAYKATIYFEDGCEMENIRAYTIVHTLKDITEDFIYIPEDILDNEGSSQVIRDNGFTIFLKANKSYEEIQDLFLQTIFLRDLQLTQLNDNEYSELIKKLDNNEQKPDETSEIQDKAIHEKTERETQSSASQNIISVSLIKLNKLMDLVGEMVVAEAMVTQNPDLKGMNLDNFEKAARQLRKISSELQDTVMSMRMVPIASTFHKMHRIVRDMGKKLDKEVTLGIIGEETEVDKNIIEHISDPLMHLVRNSIDHGIESAEERDAIGKPKVGIITLEARNAGSDVLIIIKDDGKGLNKEKILKRARENNLLHKAENSMTDKEIYSLIFLPGFSTKENVTEFSGRGVGMDVVVRNIESVGGTVFVDSTPGVGTTITMKIPLTLAIIDGMNIRVGSSCYTIPTTDIKESFRPKESDIIRDPDGNEMLMVRGQCYPILRLHEAYKVKCDTTKISEGIIVMVENRAKTLCVFADELIGEQQVVVKTLPKYIKKIRGLAGCTIMGDGKISLIIDVAGFKN